MKLKYVAMVFCLALLGTLAVPRAWANTGNEEMIVTVKKTPLEIPGKVLRPGQYDFKFVDQSHGFVEVSTANGKKEIGLFPVIPIRRRQITDSAQLELSQPRKGSLERIDEFFYPDLTTGYELVYAHSGVKTVSHA